MRGQGLTASQGQNPARQAAINAGIRKEAASCTVNQVCGSGLRSVALAAQAVQLGDSRIVVAGGQENMSLAPHAQFMRSSSKMGPVTLVDTMIHDGLTDAFNRSEEHTSELQSLMRISYAVFCLKKTQLYQKYHPRTQPTQTHDKNAQQ